MSVRIIVDSTTDMVPQLQGRVTVVPLSIHFGEEEYIDMKIHPLLRDNTIIIMMLNKSLHPYKGFC